MKDWPTSNKLKLNEGKTKALVFKHSRLSETTVDKKTTVAGITDVAIMKIFGMTVANNLSWNCNIKM